MKNFVQEFLPCKKVITLFKDYFVVFCKYWRNPYAEKSLFHAFSNNFFSVSLFQNCFFSPLTEYHSFHFISFHFRAGRCPAAAAATCILFDAFKVLIVVVVVRAKRKNFIAISLMFQQWLIYNQVFVNFHIFNNVQKLSWYWTTFWKGVL